MDEGINEFLTRKIALEKDFITNGCGYPKEVAIASELQAVFGEEVLEQISFLNRSPYCIMTFLEKKLGEKAGIYIEMFV